MDDTFELFYKQFVSSFIEHLASRVITGETLAGRMVSEGIGDNRGAVVTYCKMKLASHRVDSYGITGIKRDAVIEEFKFLESLLFDLFTRLDKPLSEDGVVLFLRYLGAMLYIGTFEVRDDDEEEEYCLHTARELLIYFRANPTGFKEIKEQVNYLRRSYYMTLHQREFFPSEDSYTYCINIVREDMSCSEKISEQEYITAWAHYVNISLDHLFHYTGRNAPYITLEKIASDLVEFSGRLKAYAASRAPDPELLYRALSSYFKITLYTLKEKKRVNEETGEELKVRLFVQCARLIAVFYGRTGGVEVFFDNNHREYALGLKEALGLFSKELVTLLGETEKNVVELLFLIFRFLYYFKEYARLNQNIYNRLIFIARACKDYQSRLLATALFLKLFDPQKFRDEIVKVKKSIEARPNITLITLYNSEIDSVSWLEEQEKNDFKIDPFILEILRYIREIRGMIKQKVAAYNLETEGKTGEGIRELKGFVKSVQNEVNNLFALGRDPNLFRGVNQYYASFLDLFIKNQKMDFREDYLKNINQIKMELLDINPLDLQVSLLLFKLGKLLYILGVREPEKVTNSSRKLEQFDEPTNSIVSKVFKEFPGLENFNLNVNQIEEIISRSVNLSVTTTSITSPGARIIKVVNALVDKINEYQKLDASLFLELYQEAYVKLRKAWVYDPIIIYYLNWYFANHKELEFVSLRHGVPVRGDVVWLKKPEIVKIIFNFVKDLLTHTQGEDDLSSQLEKLARMNCENLVGPEDKRAFVTRSRVDSFIVEQKAVVFEKTFIDQKEDLIYLMDVVRYYLMNLGRLSLFNTIKYILNELITNANRGHLKRAHFKFKGLDFELKYMLGRKSFREDMEEHLLEYKDLVKEMGGKTALRFQVLNRLFVISVVNNYPIHRIESEEINKRFLVARTISNLKQIGKLGLETPEGKGTGLVMINLLLNKLGLNRRYLKFRADAEESVFKVIFPLDKIKEKEASTLAADIAGVINTLPSLPRHVNELNQAIKNADVNLDKVEILVNRDPGLAVRVVQVANSPLFLRREKVRSLKEGIQVIGLKGLGNIALAYSSYKQLQGMINEKRMEEFIAHSEKVAFFVRRLIEHLALDLAIEDMVLPALIHDIGKIIIENRTPEMYKEITHFSKEKNLPVELVEDLLGGYYHNLVGYELTRKWDFPEVVCEVIRYHHSPRMAERYYDEIFLIYLANELTRYSEDNIVYENFDENVLEYFDLTNSREVEKICRTINREYSNFSH